MRDVLLFRTKTYIIDYICTKILKNKNIYLPEIISRSTVTYQNHFHINMHTHVSDHKFLILSG
jgi:hypothetical protein